MKNILKERSPEDKSKFLDLTDYLDAKEGGKEVEEGRVGSFSAEVVPAEENNVSSINKLDNNMKYYY